MERSPSPDLFRILEDIIPDLTQWQFPIEADSPHSLVDWLRQEDHQFLPSNSPVPPSIVIQCDPLTEFFPEISLPPSFSPCLSTFSQSSANSFDRVSTPDFGQENVHQNWVPVPYTQPPQYPYFDNAPSSCSYEQIPLKPKNNHRPVKEKKQEVCSNCKSTHSTMWRWNTKTGDRECNACNLYEATRGVRRPQSMFKDKIFKRNRKNQKKIPNENMAILN